MKTYGVVGEAGTGKTYRLVKAALQFPEYQPMGEGQKVLGLTFMHGSRHRMNRRLAAHGKAAPAYRVSTLDSFALELVRRFRRYVGLHHGEVHAEVTDEESNETGWKLERGVWRADLETVRQTAVDLLENEGVCATIRAAYPLIIIDEVQDCRGSLLSLVQGLAESTHLMAAGDPFQALNELGGCSAIEWLEEVATEIERLNTQHRTTEQAVLASASSLRTGSRSGGVQVEVEVCDSSGIAAWHIQKRIWWDGWKGSAALITPARPDSSRFVKGVIESLHRPKKHNLYPAPFQWEGTVQEQMTEAIEEVCGRFGDRSVLSSEDLREAISETATDRASRVGQQLLKRMRLTGKDEVTIEEVEEAVRRRLHAERVYQVPANDSGRRAMTIHGAKNREFDNVFVVWPYEVRSDQEAARRLLYNAITRAKQRAVVLTQGKDRTSKDAALACIV